MDRNPPEACVVPFARRWHVIHEIDLIRLIRAHRQRLALCAQAEEMADRLPERPAEPVMADFLTALDSLVLGGQREEGHDLRVMLSSGREDALGRTLLDHVQYRQLADVAAARELVAAFDEGNAFATPETLGHMLRSFFTGCRRAVDFEQLTIIALAGHRLTPEARSLLIDALADSLLD